MVVTRRLWLALAIVGSGCSSDPRPAAPPTAVTSQSPLTRTGIEGCNCAGAAPAMLAPDGAAYPFQSIVAYYYQVLQAFWTKIDGDDVLKTWLPASIEATGEEFYAWQAKSVQIYRDRTLLGFAHRYYRGIFGFLDTQPGGSPASCTPALDPGSRVSGMLAHVGLSQAGVCGRNDDGTTKFWQVNRIVLLMIGDVLDASALIDAGVAHAVDAAPADRCILPPAGVPAPVVTPVLGGDAGIIPCRIAFRDDAVTEALVLPVPSQAVVAGVPLGYRAFTAAGTVTMPNGLDEVRTILRDGQLRAMYAIGLPRFAPEPSAGPTQVRLVGHAIGPSARPSPILLPEERSWVDGTVGGYTDRCCHVECGGDGSAAPGLASAAAAVVRRDAGVPDAAVHDARLPDAGVPDATAFPDVPPLPGPVDAGVAVPGSPPPGPVPGPGSSGPPAPGPGSNGPPAPGPGSNGPPAPGPGSDAPPPPPGDPAPPPGCRTVCTPEGACTTGSAGTGLVVLVSAQTSKECNGSCPEPATDAPATQPTCAP